MLAPPAAIPPSLLVSGNIVCGVYFVFFSGKNVGKTRLREERGTEITASVIAPLFSMRKTQIWLLLSDLRQVLIRKSYKRVALLGLDWIPDRQGYASRWALAKRQTAPNPSFLFVLPHPLNVKPV